MFLNSSLPFLFVSNPVLSVFPRKLSASMQQLRRTNDPYSTHQSDVSNVVVSPTLVPNPLSKDAKDTSFNTFFVIFVSIIPLVPFGPSCCVQDLFAHLGRSDHPSALLVPATFPDKFSIPPASFCFFSLVFFGPHISPPMPVGCRVSADSSIFFFKLKATESDFFFYKRSE